MSVTFRSVPMGPGDDPTRRAIQTALTGLEAKIDRYGWDEQPLLAFLYRVGVDAPVPGVTLMALAVEPVPVPDEAWRVYGPPANVLSGLAAVPNIPLAVHRHRGGRSDLIGIVFVSEVWWVEMDPGEELPEGQTASQSPNRAERRMVYALDNTGEQHLVCRTRGSNRIECSVYAPGVDVGLTAETTALASLLATVTGGDGNGGGGGS